MSLASLESVAVLDTDRLQPGALRRDASRPSPASWWPWSGRRGRARPPSASSLPRLYDVTVGAIRINGLDVRDATLASLTDTIGVVTQDAHLFHETIRENLLFAKPDATDGELGAALAGAQIATMVGRPARRPRHRGR